MMASRVALLASPFLIAASSLALADTSPLDPVSIWIGGYYANTDTSLSAKTRDGNIDTGKLHLETGDDTVGRARLDVLLFGNQGLQFDYYTLDHSTTQTLTQPFSYQGIPFELNTTLRGKLEFGAGSASYHWWFQTDNDAFGVGLGGAYLRAKLKVSGTVSLDGQSAAASAAWDEDAVAPVVTLAYKHAFNDAFRFYLDGQGIYKNGGALSGRIYDGRAGFEWFPWHNVGLAAEYGYSRIKLDREASSYDANLDIKLHGPSLFARFRF
jgi:hypothetical protein